MNERLQRWLDEIIESSRDQWVLRVLVAVAPVVAAAATGPAGGAGPDAGLALIGVIAFAAAVRSDSAIPTLAVLLVGWRWLATVEGIDSPWLPVAAVGLLVHHVAAALLATIPTGGRLPRSVAIRWTRQTAVVASATVFVWGTTAVLDGRDEPGNAALTGLALAGVAGIATLVRARSVARRTPPV